MHTEKHNGHVSMSIFDLVTKTSAVIQCCLSDNNIQMYDILYQVDRESNR